MASPTIPASGPPVAPARRTRKPDAWTTLFFALTGALGAWSLALIALTVLRIIDPTRDPDDDLSALKSVGAITVALIAVEQAFTMGAAMGKVPKLGLPMRTLMRTHRYVGRLGLVLAAVVAFLCWTVSPAPSRDGALHGAFASSGFLAISVKLALLKWRPALAYRVAPWLGAYAALAFILVAVLAAEDLGDELFDISGSDKCSDNSGSDNSGSDNSGSDNESPDED